MFPRCVDQRPFVGVVLYPRQDLTGVFPASFPRFPHADHPRGDQINRGDRGNEENRANEVKRFCLAHDPENDSSAIGAPQKLHAEPIGRVTDNP
jgi:hypothetical protein